MRACYGCNFEVIMVKLRVLGTHHRWLQASFSCFTLVLRGGTVYGETTLVSFCLAGSNFYTSLFGNKISKVHSLLFQQIEVWYRCP